MTLAQPADDVLNGTAWRQNTLQHALRCGERLHEVKMNLDHGDWTGWLARNFAGSQSTAVEYMRLAQAKRRNPDVFAGLPDSITVALKVLRGSVPVQAPDRPARPVVETSIAHDQPGVYFLEAGAGGPVKIGVVRRVANLPGRLRSLQPGCPYPLNVLALIPGDLVVEATLHRRLAEHRLCGEWFAREPALAAMDSHLEVTA